jgi:UDP-N-acetylmuramoyl-L-alanyl-D-glutamate--2,6-diaminopimelate ligase
MKLATLLSGFAEIDSDLEIGGLGLDSRRLKAGDAFIALNGSLQHGLKHVGQALANGATAVIYDPQGSEGLLGELSSVPAVAVTDLGQQLGTIASRFYGQPSRQLDVIGITGTNGKTTCSQLLAQALNNCGIIGTLGWGQPGNLQPTANTTPDALAVQQMLRSFVDQGSRSVAMEVSSHGLQQGRVNGVEFSGAVFTNLTRDHLDYHGDMEQYLQAKLALFSCSSLRFAAINLDDPSNEPVLKTLDASVKCWGFSTSSRRVDDVECVVASNVEHHADGIDFDVNWNGQTLPASTPIAGAFNLYNVMTVLCVLLAMGNSFSAAVAKLAKLQPVSGRMEKFGGNGKPAVFVDYAHTPDALEKVLNSVNCNGRLWAVFGCGGDRDRGKRPEMGRIAESLADCVVLTDDNPRSEAPEAIINEILQGCRSNKTRVINDRRTAITTVIKQAAQCDCVVVAGKGHENYQQIGEQKLPFSDQAVVEAALSAWGEPA